MGLCGVGVLSIIEPIHEFWIWTILFKKLIPSPLRIKLEFIWTNSFNLLHVLYLSEFQIYLEPTPSDRFLHVSILPTIFVNPKIDFNGKITTKDNSPIVKIHTHGFDEVQIISSSLALSIMDRRGSWAFTFANTGYLDYTRSSVLLR